MGKATCWKILLGYLPTKTSEWQSHLQQQRNLYEFYINLLFQNPDTYENGQGPNNHHQIIKHAHAQSVTFHSNMQQSQSLDAFRANTIHKNTYFQDENDNANKNKNASHAFFEDSDEERQPKPGLFDSDDGDDDILNIVDDKKKKENEETKLEENKTSKSNE